MYSLFSSRLGSLSLLALASSAFALEFVCPDPPTCASYGMVSGLISLYSGQGSDRRAGLSERRLVLPEQLVE